MDKNFICNYYPPTREGSPSTPKSPSEASIFTPQMMALSATGTHSSAHSNQNTGYLATSDVQHRTQMTSVAPADGVITHGEETSGVDVPYDSEQDAEGSDEELEYPLVSVFPPKMYPTHPPLSSQLITELILCL